MAAVVDVTAPPAGTSVEVLTVGDVMLRGPKVLPADVGLDRVRALLADEHVHVALLVEGPRLVGTVVRDDLPPSGDGRDEGPALPHARLAGRTTTADAPVEQVRRWMVETGVRRLAVVDEHQVLLGLLCLKRRRTGFCSDDDVAARAADPR